nr:uncharacterized protein LOC107449391 [Parasteatoda tepidariorum]
MLYKILNSYIFQQESNILELVSSSKLTNEKLNEIASSQEKIQRELSDVKNKVQSLNTNYSQQVGNINRNRSEISLLTLRLNNLETSMQLNDAAAVARNFWCDNLGQKLQSLEEAIKDLKQIISNPVSSTDTTPSNPEASPQN